MASPQAENGHVRIATDLFEAECRVQMSGQEWQVYRFIQRKTWGWGKKAERISLKQFAEGTGMPRQRVFEALKGLESKNMILSRKNVTNQPKSYEIQKDFEQWELSRKTVMSRKSVTRVTGKRDRRVTGKRDTTKAKDAEIIEDSSPYNYKDNYLNITKEFETFWERYPRKVGKGQAERAFKRARKDKGDDFLSMAIQALDAQRLETKEKQFIPYPATWLNGKRWEDEVEVERERGLAL